MKFVRNVVQDLVEKKLWPVAVALIAALVAVPLVLGGKSDSGSAESSVAAAPRTAAPAADHDVSGSQVVALDEQAVGEVHRDGRVRDPFVQQHVPKPPSAADAAKSALQATKDLVNSLGNGSSGGGSPSTGGGTPVIPSPQPSTPPADTGSKGDKKTTLDTYRVSLKFGEPGAEKTYKNVARLTPLPSSTNPWIIFLGLSDDGKSAVFLVDSQAMPSGDGVCRPDANDCQQIVLKKNDVEFFDLQTGTAGVAHYQLEITDIGRRKADTTATAAKAHARESRAGRELLRQLLADDPETLSTWDFSSDLGLLMEKEPADTDDIANIPVGIAAAAQGQAPSTATPSFTAQP